METIRNKKHVNASKSLQNEGGFLISFHPDEVSRKYFLHRQVGSDYQRLAYITNDY